MKAAPVKPAPPVDKLLRLPEVLKRIPVSRTTWWRGVSTGRYPPAVRIGPNSTAWRESDINRLVAGPE